MFTPELQWQTRGKWHILQGGPGEDWKGQLRGKFGQKTERAALAAMCLMSRLGRADGPTDRPTDRPSTDRPIGRPVMVKTIALLAHESNETQLLLCILH